MSHKVVCYRCGASLAMLSLPLSRQDECPECRNYLHVCRMCVNFAPGRPRQCVEDDAEEVLEKERLNFCDWFIASESAFDARRKIEEDAARAALEGLFGDGGGDAAADPATTEAEKLFK
jgi:hypothetical protein